MIEVFPLIGICILLVTTGQVCFRMGARHENNEETGALSSFLEVLRRPVLWLGVAAFITHFCVWMLVLNKVNLGVAYPLMSLDYVMVTLCSAVFLGETVNRKRWVGVFLIVVGVALIGSADPPPVPAITTSSVSSGLPVDSPVVNSTWLSPASSDFLCSPGAAANLRLNGSSSGPS